MTETPPSGNRWEPTAEQANSADPAATSSESTARLVCALAILGIGWNLGLVAGSIWLTAGTPAADRPRREAWGEVAMGTAAAWAEPGRAC